jgi:hypothetical protein
MVDLLLTPLGVILLGVVLYHWGPAGRWLVGAVVTAGAIMLVIAALSDDKAIQSLFLALLFLSPLLVLLTPRRLYPAMLAIVIPTIGWWFWAMTRPVSASADWAALGEAIVIFLITVLMAAAVIRVIIDGMMASPGKAVTPVDWTISWSALTATMLALLGWHLAPPVARLITVPGLLLLAASTAISLCCYTIFTQQRARWFALAAALTLVGSSAVALCWPPYVMTAATMAAAGRPYCIMIADGETDYVAARSQLDLTPLSMRATETPGVRNHHAILVVRDRAGDQPDSYFSYYRRRFEPGVQLTPENPLCEPRPQFSAGLPLFGTIR